MFKADTGLTVSTALTIFVILADFVLSTLMLKKLTETAFCVTKNRFFPILFLICNYRTTVRAVTLFRGELGYYNILSISLSSVFHNFFRIFLEFFFGVFRTPRIPSEMLSSRSDSLAILSHLFMKVNCFSRFFCLFLWFFCDYFLATIYCVFDFSMLQ